MAICGYIKPDTRQYTAKGQALTSALKLDIMAQHRRLVNIGQGQCMGPISGDRCLRRTFASYYFRLAALLPRGDQPS